MMADQIFRVAVVNKDSDFAKWVQLSIPDDLDALSDEAFRRYWKPALMCAYLNATINAPVSVPPKPDNRDLGEDSE